MLRTAPLFGVICTGYFFASWKKSQIEASESDLYVKIGDRIARTFDGSTKTYTVFGATGHSLDTCKEIKQNCIEKKHQQRLYFVIRQADIRIAGVFAEKNAMNEKSDSKQAAIAFLGTAKPVQIHSDKHIGAYLDKDSLNTADSDIQVVHIERLNSTKSLHRREKERHEFQSEQSAEDFYSQLEDLWVKPDSIHHISPEDAE
jgi:hypothetical protein